MRAAQMAGAMEAALGLATTYANDRVQFGRPIGKFQAIQQQLALLAEEAAAALVAVESAAISRRRGAAIGRIRARRREDPGRRGGRRGRRDRASGARRDRLHRGTLLAPPDPAAVVVARRVRRRSLLGRSARPAHRGFGRRRVVAADYDAVRPPREDRVREQAAAVIARSAATKQSRASTSRLPARWSSPRVAMTDDGRGETMSTHHTVACRPEHCHWGFFDSALPPVVTVASGDTVTLDCVSGGRPTCRPTRPSKSSPTIARSTRR